VVIGIKVEKGMEYVDIIMEIYTKVNGKIIVKMGLGLMSIHQEIYILDNGLIICEMDKGSMNISQAAIMMGNGNRTGKKGLDIHAHLMVISILGIGKKANSMGKVNVGLVKEVDMSVNGKMVNRMVKASIIMLMGINILVNHIHSYINVYIILFMLLGEWKDNKKEGKGEYLYENGNRYEGEWKDDLRDG